VRDRETLVAELARLRGRGEISTFTDNAQQLLTRWWSTADWSARGDLLRAASWMMKLQTGAQSPALNANNPNRPA
jgi:hypothetical protein